MEMKANDCNLTKQRNAANHGLVFPPVHDQHSHLLDCSHTERATWETQRLRALHDVFIPKSCASGHLPRTVLVSSKKPNYKTACEESRSGKNPNGATPDYKFNVTSMELYICTELMDVSPTGTEVLHLMEHQVQSKPLSGPGDKNFDFTVPPSTKAISIFVQSGSAGTNTMCPPSLLGCKTVGVGNDG